jgi:ribonuclease J
MTRKSAPSRAPAAPPGLNRPDELVFLPLGGAGEIGMNLNLYGYAGKWLMVDLGISFAEEDLPGVEIIMADPSFIAARKDDLVGLIVTHAHEDHIGAIQYLWPRLMCPVYTTPFTAAVLRLKLAETGLLGQVPIIEVPLSGHAQIGPFAVDFVSLTHSVPEPNALVIRTPAGNVFHTGDWKFDPNPIVGRPTDFNRLHMIGELGIDALIGDSTNALRPGDSGSEADVRSSLVELVGRFDGRVAIACFASNVARLHSAAAAAEANARSSALVGRSLWRMHEAAQANGYLKGLPTFLRDEAAMELPREHTLLICTGSQGEPRSALARIANDDHPAVTLEAGDTVIFSSRVIPGNERAIGRLQNQLAKRGIDIITDDDHFVHVSGHPAQEELARMYHMIRPRLAVPVHGEERHLIAHAKLAKDCQVPEALVIRNGQMVRLAPGPGKVIDEVDTGILGLDGKGVVSLDGGPVRDRARMTWNGSAVATVVIDARGKLAVRPLLTAHGVVDEADEVAISAVEEAIKRALEGLAPHERGDDEAVREKARAAIRRSFSQSHGKKPVTDIHVIRV